MTNKDQEYGKFQGSTEATLQSVLGEIRGLREDFGIMSKDIESLKSWRSYTLGAAAVFGILASFVKDMILKTK